MWLTKKETAEKAESVKTGVVTTGGGEISVCTELERRAPTVTVPYGMSVSVPQGTEAVMTGGEQRGNAFARRGAAVLSGRCGDRFEARRHGCYQWAGV